MKKLLSIFIIIFTLLLFISGLFNNSIKQPYIRIHVKANSNLSIDQNIKYEIKDKIISYLIKDISNCKTRKDFVLVIKNNLNNVEEIANNILKQKGFLYKCKVDFNKEKFPTRCYDGLVLKSGIYDSLMVNLGEAKGDNWWCVVYPPLCFISNNTQDVMYKSRILEILKSIFNK